MRISFGQLKWLTIVIPIDLKSRLVLAPVVVSLYNDARYWVIYHLSTKKTLEVWLIGKIPDKPRLNPAVQIGATRGGS